MSEEITPEVENNSENIEEGKEEEGTLHPFDRMFFGGAGGSGNRRPLFDRPVQQTEHSNETANEYDMLSSILNHPNLKNINLDEMMTHVDNLMTSLGELKPMFQKVSPLISKFIQNSKE
ncbi:hypothetical protein [Heyndrickxia vini]|uniref:Uncharacterized protein n=1 Tax=Heyndrickxia vini TaxID=1476025 RepID=A0ABX7DYT6_9BACI|nr:hypothetical protein [Heyndrickxia vini]QQZ08230.1 hypothetical protein I5776_14255 [Heyndrickxia vini]